MRPHPDEPLDAEEVGHAVAAALAEMATGKPGALAELDRLEAELARMSERLAPEGAGARALASLRGLVALWRRRGG